VSEGASLVREKMEEHPEFGDIRKRMLLAWQEGVTGLRARRIYAVGDWHATKAFEGISDPPKLQSRPALGRSPLLGDRSKRPRVR
jgi:serine/threonine-protein kinase HipA